MENGDNGVKVQENMNFEEHLTGNKMGAEWWSWKWGGQWGGLWIWGETDCADDEPEKERDIKTGSDSDSSDWRRIREGFSKEHE